VVNGYTDLSGVSGGYTERTLHFGQNGALPASLLLAKKLSRQWACIM